MKAILWGYKYNNMRQSWTQQMNWLVDALRNNKVEVYKHSNFICKNLKEIKIYNPVTDKDFDICIYNHCDISHIVGDVIKVKRTWFFKPTVPDEFHTTLDTLGYGPYSSITYDKPNFKKVNKIDVDTFFKIKVNNWIKNKDTKWGSYFENKETEIEYKDYFLVLGQYFGDEVVTRHDFGNYFSKLANIVKELSRVTDKLIVVKLHPYMDGEYATHNKLSLSVKEKLEAIDSKVKVFIGKNNIHNFIENSSCVLLANSGSGFEVMMHQKPIITWGYPEYHWVTYDLRHLADLGRAIKLDWFNKEEQNKFLYWYMEKYCFYNQETANRRVKEMLNGRL